MNERVIRLKTLACWCVATAIGGYFFGDIGAAIPFWVGVVPSLWKYTRAVRRNPPE